ncbi:MAG TPA: hypothetical protein VEY11_10210 [Pyrinomonadaceae bacterium]|nr:hypothetical protein [Pyrinomonadaceae bacterium]
MKLLAVQTSLIVLLLCAGVSAQGKTALAGSLSKPYWLNHNLIFLKGCRPLVSPHNITFTEGDCDIDANSGKIFSRATKVKIYSVTSSKGFAAVRFRHWPEIYELDTEYEILLRSDSAKNFNRSFRLLFSERDVTDDQRPECPDELKTKAQVIKCMGFPLSVTRRGGMEKYSYIMEFAGFSYLGYDGWTVELKRNNVINVWGNI